MTWCIFLLHQRHYASISGQLYNADPQQSIPVPGGSDFAPIWPQPPNSGSVLDDSSRPGPNWRPSLLVPGSGQHPYWREPSIPALAPSPAPRYLGPIPQLPLDSEQEKWSAVPNHLSSTELHACINQSFKWSLTSRVLKYLCLFEWYHRNWFQYFYCHYYIYNIVQFQCNIIQ